MEVNFWLVSLPAFISLALKAGIYLYARFSQVHNLLTRLYLFALFSFSIQNIAEIAHFYTFIKRGVIPNHEVNIFYAATIIAYAFLFHLVVKLVFDRNDRLTRNISVAIYLYALTLEVLLFFTPWLISGYTPIRNYTVTRIPGPLYGAFEIYAIGICLAMLGLLAYGIRQQVSAFKRSQMKIILLAVTPLNLVLVAVLVMLHTGVRLFNASVTMPAALMLFLFLTAYATHQYRLFDIDFFIPWSKVRKRKTAFYQRIQATVSELAGLRSVDDALSRVADILHCSAALVGGWRPVLARAGAGSFEMAQFPGEKLGNIRRIVVANEISDVSPELHRTMKQFGVAAIVPFHPHSKTAASWLLLGDSFSDSVYTPLDFKNVERLFDNLGEFFLDRIAFLRAELGEAQQQTRIAEDRLEKIEKELEEIREENLLLRNYNFRLMRENSHMRNALDSRPAATKAAPALKLILKPGADSDRSLDERVAHFETRLIRQALKHCDGDISGAAQLLGLDMDTLHEKIKRYRIGDAEEPE